MSIQYQQRIVKPSSAKRAAAGVVSMLSGWRRGLLSMVLLIAVCGAWLHAEQPVSKDQAALRLQGLAWMTGEWTASRGEDVLEERWSAPIGDSMVGTFRWIKAGGKVWMFELMTITAKGDDVIFRLRHFSDEMVPWEGVEKEPALTYKLIKQTSEESVFENPNRDSPRRFIFRKGDDSLTVVLEGYKDGKPTTGSFPFSRG